MTRFREEHYGTRAHKAWVKAGKPDGLQARKLQSSHTQGVRKAVQEVQRKKAAREAQWRMRLDDN